MKRRAPLALAAIAAVAAAWSADASPAQTPVTSRSFTIIAEAFPAAPVPGRGGTELGTRPLGSRVSVSNAPASAYGRSAIADNGTIELYTGPPPKGSVAECDTTSTNLPRRATVDAGSAQLTAECRDAPGAVAAADGSFSDSAAGSQGSGSSRAEGDGGGSAARGASSSRVNDYTQGPVHIGSARYDASGETDGTPGGGRGTGHVEVSDATVGGVPVVIGPNGVSVDQSKVPTELVGGSTAAVHDALAQGGYLDIRAAQPEVVVAPDGSSVLVRGGGVFFEGQSNDPTQPYFVRQTIVGGSLTVAVGSDITDAMAEPPAPLPPSPDIVPNAAPAAATPSAVLPDVAVAAEPAAQLISQQSTHATSPFGLRWLWILALMIVSAVVAYVFRRQLAPWWNALADRYVRG